MFRRRARARDVTQAFRDNQQLQKFFLDDVTATEKVLGTGSYGSVVEVWHMALTLLPNTANSAVFVKSFLANVI